MPSNSLNNQQVAGSSSGELASSERLNNHDGFSGASLDDDRLNIRNYLDSMSEGLLFLTEPEFDEAIVGLGDRIGMETVVVYDTTKIIDILCERDGMERDEATEFYEFNIAGAYVGERTPLFISLIDDMML